MARAYVIVETRAVDEAKYERYRELAAPAVAAYGGSYLVRGAEIERMEGEPVEDDRRQVVIVFESMADAKRWYASPEYAEALAVRHDGALERRLSFVEGLETGPKELSG